MPRILFVFVAAVLLAFSSAAVAEPDVALPGNFFYPEGVATDGQGNFYVGSLTLGDIEYFAPGDTNSTPFASGVLSSAIGLYYDASADTLWACGTRPNGDVGLQGFDPATGQGTAFHIFSDGGFCNDIAQDDDGNLYITDSAQWRVMKVAAEDRLSNTPAEHWLSDPLFDLEPGEGTGLSVNGIVHHRKRLYIVNITRGELYSVKIRGNGQPGKVKNIQMERPLDGPDGIEVLGHNRLLVMENFTNSITEVDLRGHHDAELTVLASGLADSPTTAEIVDGTAWVVISQLDRLFSGNPNPPVLPFHVQPVDISDATSSCGGNGGGHGHGGHGGGHGH